jgi:hypothetical protein
MCKIFPKKLRPLEISTSQSNKELPKCIWSSWYIWPLIKTLPVNIFLEAADIYSMSSNFCNN